MTFSRKAIPKDSLLTLWVDSRSIIETPIAFDVACAIAATGASLKRNAWVDQVKWRVYPNMSILLVGPSGIGKDTAIDGGEEIIRAIDRVRVVGGRTSETLLEQFYNLGDPAAGVILAHELSAFFGKKDYQASMIQDLTDLMSTKGYKDISLKSTMATMGCKRIQRPTPTVIGGSTAEWIHTGLPPGALDGGFLPRFLIVCEEYAKKHVPLVKYSISPAERKESNELQDAFFKGVRQNVLEVSTPTEYPIIPEARSIHDNWYANREKYFPAIARAYAHRCRDHLLRISLISAILRSRVVIDEVDITFGITLINYIASKIDSAVALPSAEARIGKDILAVLPSTQDKILRILTKFHTLKAIREAQVMLLESRQMNYNKGDGVYSRLNNE